MTSRPSPVAAPKAHTELVRLIACIIYHDRPLAGAGRERFGQASTRGGDYRSARAAYTRCWLVYHSVKVIPVSQSQTVAQ